MEKIKVGIIGCGGIANGKHMPSIKTVKEVEMVAFCDIIEERAVEAAKKFGTPDAKVYTDYKELLKDESIVAVHVCTPNRSHSFISIDALEAGKHVICEKPMAKTYAEAKAMYEASVRTGKILTIGYQSRWRGDSMYLKQCCANGELGEIYYARAVALRRRAVPTWGVFLNEYEQGGGPLIDIGTHSLDLTLWMMDNYKPKMVVGTKYKKLGDQKNAANAWGDWDPEKFTVEDSAFGFVVMENGATVSVESSWALNIADPHEAMTVVCGDKGGADMFDDLRLNYVKNGRQVIERPSFDAGGVAFYEGASDRPEVLECHCFYNAILHGGEIVTKPEQAMVVTQILEAIYQSAETGKPVYLNEEA
ncbi:MAG: Gfo/Idh/MocA family oxidoreductase [Clostridia bacterium]|nr:Gfo/Idh/MocA family oxidoreductase [Clostridia bacterium]